MKNLIIILLTFGSFLSCSNHDDNPSNSEILGEWKLIEARIINFENNPLIDYSKENIIYNFKANRVLSVTGGNNVGYPNGEYDYIFEKDYLGGAPSPGEEKILLVKVNNNTKWTYTLTYGRMTLGNSYVDGPDLIFERK